MPLPLPPAGLYAITDSRLIPDGKLNDCVTQAIEGGAVLVQYREKHRSRAQREQEAAGLARLCHQRGVPLLINDDIELARAVDADGVHLGRNDIGPEEARNRLGRQAIIGVSCYNRLERARQACRAGASYVAFGRFFPSRTKPGAVQAQPELLVRAHRELDVPVAAIGGITPDNAAALVAAGADLLAVIHGLFGQTAIQAAGRRYAALFAETGGLCPARAGREPADGSAT
jgi:thiamine-phosphate pyrophosphorylase